MIIRNFEYLLALNTEKHFSRAAAACSVSQPTLSAGIKQLEEDMNVPIVKRGRRFEGFTPEGERVLAWARQMMEDCQRLKRELHELKEQAMQGPFRVGALHGTIALATTLSIPFMNVAPELQLSIETMDEASLLHRVRDGKVDIAITWLDDVPRNGLETHLLYREQALFFSSKVTASRRIPLSEVVRTPLCLLHASLPPQLEEQLQQAANILYTNSPAVLAAHVSTGQWSTVLPQSLASYLPATASLQATLLAQHAQFGVGFAMAQRSPQPPPVATWIELTHTPNMVAAIRKMLNAHKPFLKRPTAKHAQ